MQAIARRLGYIPKNSAPRQYVVRPQAQRNFLAGVQDRLTADFGGDNDSIDKTLRSQLQKLRGRSRDLWKNNDYARKFGRLWDVNVIGPHGIRWQAKTRFPNGKPDPFANRIIEGRFADWSRPENCTVTGTLSWLEVQHLVGEALPRDGEIILRKVVGFDNAHRFALQIVEPDHLDEQHWENLRNGNRIRCGIEFNPWGRPVAYHLLTEHPGGEPSTTYTRKTTMRIPADQIVHVYLPDRPGQSRGYPLIHTAIVRLKMIGAYEEAALIAARMGAAKMGFYTSQTGTEYKGDGTDGSGNLIQEAEPGHMEQLPDGIDFKPYDPTYPHGEFPEFRKAVLMGAAAGMGLSYPSASGDLEGVNYSSIRQGVLEERDVWKAYQERVTQRCHEPVTNSWLDVQLLNGSMSPLSLDKAEKYRARMWQPRRWGWVDPLKDIQANVMAINAGLRSPQMIAAEEGNDLDDVYAQIAAAKELAKTHGISFSEIPADGGVTDGTDDQND